MTIADYYLIQDINKILENGVMDKDPRPKYEDGTPAHTYFITHNVRSYDLSKGEFPITSLRPIAWKSAIKEILWIYQDKSNDLNLLNEKYKIGWWNEWQSKDIPGTIGCRYGHTINTYDLFNKRVLDDIINEPYSRYHICNLWQEEELNRSDGLKPCAYETIWNVRGKYLDMLLNQRSGDMLVASGAGNVNEVQYAALLIMVSRHTGYTPGKFTHVIANEQIYDRHLSQAKELCERAKKLEAVKNMNPQLILNSDKNNFYDITIDDFSMKDYCPMKPNLKFDLGI